MLSYRLFKLCACLAMTNQMCFEHMHNPVNENITPFCISIALSHKHYKFQFYHIYIFQLQQLQDNDSLTTKLTFLLRGGAEGRTRRISAAYVSQNLLLLAVLGLRILNIEEIFQQISTNGNFVSIAFGRDCNC